MHYGEFQWAFFNRRSLARKYKRHTIGLTSDQITDKFHRYDINGDGVLSIKEFKRLLLDFEIKLSDTELDMLIDRFDRDGDGEINLSEFKDFMECEVNKLGSGLTHKYESLRQPSVLRESQDRSMIGKSSPDKTNHRLVSSQPAEIMLQELLNAQSKLESKLGHKFFSNVS